MFLINLRSLHFNPRPPWGGRPPYFLRCPLGIYISIHALRGEGDRKDTDYKAARMGISIHALRGEGDCHLCRFLGIAAISIHALRGEGDAECLLIMFNCVYFNPRPPWGGRPAEELAAGTGSTISIHALRGEGDDYIGKLRAQSSYFNPRPPWGGRL